MRCRYHSRSNRRVDVAQLRVMALGKEHKVQRVFSCGLAENLGTRDCALKKAAVGPLGSNLSFGGP
jgi:hypothetical protein